MSVDRVTAVRPRTGKRGPHLRLLPAVQRSSRAAFVILILTLLGVGLVGLLVLNTSLQQSAFDVEELRNTTTELRDQRAALAEEVSERSAPGQLARQAERLGMIPAEDPSFIVVGTDGPR
jgi:hypothetical protein